MDVMVGVTDDKHIHKLKIKEMKNVTFFIISRLEPYLIWNQRTVKRSACERKKNTVKQVILFFFLVFVMQSSWSNALSFFRYNEKQLNQKKKRLF